MFEIDKQKDTLKLIFSASLAHVDRAEQVTREFLENIGRGDCIFDVVLLMREALNNSVQRGCLLDETMKVKYSLTLEETSLIMKVEDEGDGFDWRTCMDVRQPTESERGRGLRIMKEYSDELSYNDKGNALTIVKRLTGCR